MLFNNTDGKPDAVLTMAVLAMGAILIKFLLSGFIITVTGTTVVTFGVIDSGVVGAILTPTLGAYVARRYTEKKFSADLNNNGKIDDDEKVP